MRSIRSLGNNLPRLRWRSTYLPPPPLDATVRRSRSVDIRAVLCSLRV